MEGANVRSPRSRLLKAFRLVEGVRQLSSAPGPPLKAPVPPQSAPIQQCASPASSSRGLSVRPATRDAISPVDLPRGVLSARPSTSPHSPRPLRTPSSLATSPLSQRRFQSPSPTARADLSSGLESVRTARLATSLAPIDRQRLHDLRLSQQLVPLQNLMPMWWESHTGMSEEADSFDHEHARLASSAQRALESLSHDTTDDRKKLRFEKCLHEVQSRRYRVQPLRLQSAMPSPRSPRRSPATASVF